MACQIKVYSMKDFIRLNERGDLDVARSKSLIRRLATVASIHSSDNVLIDLRQTTVVGKSMNDILEIASEFVSYRSWFTGKIANVIPADPERWEIARRFKMSLSIHGFEYEIFKGFEEAIEWLSTVTSVKP